MTRTKILLAFGLHAERGIFGAEKKFFSKAVSRFFDRNMRKRGAALIMEAFDMMHELKPDSFRKIRSETRKDWESFSDSISEGQKRLERRFQAMFERGEMPPELAAAQWGFEELLLSANRSRSGTVHFFMEKPHLGLHEAYFDSVILRDDFLNGRVQGRRPIDIIVEHIKMVARMVVGRDKTVFNLARRLAWQDPQRAIIIPRGYKHHGMRSLFDRKDFDVTVEMGVNPTDMNYAGLVASRSYQGELPREVYEQYGTLEGLLLSKLAKLESEDPKAKRSAEGALALIRKVKKEVEKEYMEMFDGKVDIIDLSGKI